MTYRVKIRLNTQRYAIYGVFIFSATLIVYLYPRLIFLLVGITFVALLELDYREWKSFAILNKQGFRIEKHYLFGLIKIISTTNINNPVVLDQIVHQEKVTFKELNKQMNSTIKFEKVKG